MSSRERTSITVPREALAEPQASGSGRMASCRLINSCDLAARRSHVWHRTTLRFEESRRKGGTLSQPTLLHRKARRSSQAKSARLATMAWTSRGPTPASPKRRRSKTRRGFGRLFTTNVRALFFLVKQPLPFLYECSSIVLSSVAAKAAAGTLHAYAANEGVIDPLVKQFAASLVVAPHSYPPTLARRRRCTAITLPISHRRSRC